MLVSFNTLSSIGAKFFDAAWVTFNRFAQICSHGRGDVALPVDTKKMLVINVCTGSKVGHQATS